ncbi:MAG: UDP-N-acetylmuramoyl-L-alanyl-D-glutamate--2,6-diaminopimelate ligase [Spirochaetes bacterium]|nr:UDP-N-acetylmuramoyl-L-alanyl-D-glutamate--2,6-diaminopimelate ligase [Spirochaetota bacterium]
MNEVIKKSMPLGALMNNIKCGIKIVSGNIDKEIASVEYDSRKVNDKALFIAVPGFVTDGHLYVKDAVEKGAGAVLVSDSKAGEFKDSITNGTVVLAASDTRRALSAFSAAVFGNPTSKAPVIGITGTNGKTSITYMIEAVLRDFGMRPGVVGTVNYRWKDKVVSAPNTTPESRDLQEIFANMIADGVNVIVMEVSSHALKLFRVEDIDFNIAAFTNLTRDHLDFHKSFEDYFNSKKKLFQLLGKSMKDNKAGIVNIDDFYGRKICESTEFGYPVLGFGIDKSAEYKVDEKSISSSLAGLSYALEKPARGINIRLNVLGSFQMYNSLCAFAVCHRMGVPVSIIKKGLEDLKVIPGRFDSIKSKSGFYVIIDYAHTGDAVLKLLASARELKPDRIITLIGCGGNRDRTKRPVMGKTAVAGSDWVIFTSDNPRDEDPDEIIMEITSGLSGTNFETITDREKAIKKAIFMAKENDLVVLAGKGHEDYQIIKGRKTHFDDHEIASKYIEERENN